MALWVGAVALSMWPDVPDLLCDSVGRCGGNMCCVQVGMCCQAVLCFVQIKVCIGSQVGILPAGAMGAVSYLGWVCCVAKQHVLEWF
jgi:hypothetical protein